MHKLTKLSTLLVVLSLFAGQKQAFVAFGQNYDAMLDDAAINNEIKELNSGISEKKDRIKQIQDQQQKYSQAISEKQAEKATLANQLAILDNRLAKAELDITNVELDIDQVNLEIKKTDLEINNRNIEIDNEKSHMESVLRLMNKQDNVSTLEILVMNDSLAKFLSQTKYLENINDEVGKSLKNIENLKRQLEKSRELLAKKNAELEGLKTELKDKREKLSAEKSNKSTIISQVDMTEKQYQRLLAQAKQEQMQAEYDIASLEKRVRDRMAELEKNHQADFSSSELIWPVPKNVITSIFHDPDYPFKYIFEHPAIDIRAPQGTPIRAAASGYVARAKDAGKGYSYIMLVHGDGISTVYGHVSKIVVSDDDYVTQGQLIGYSGGLPGTPGAGKLTTGAHLHFEVRKNGIPTDPQQYLP